jgi:hypothetical protein
MPVLQQHLYMPESCQQKFAKVVRKIEKDTEAGRDIHTHTERERERKEEINNERSRCKL